VVANNSLNSKFKFNFELTINLVAKFAILRKNFHITLYFINIIDLGHIIAIIINLDPNFIGYNFIN